MEPWPNLYRNCLNQKNPRAHKNKIGTSPPPPNPKYPPPKNEEFFGHRFSCRKNAFFPGVHNIGAAFFGPRIADTNFTDTRIFLIKARPVQFGALPAAAEQLFINPGRSQKIEPNFEVFSWF